MTLYLVRHGLTDYLVEGRSQGHAPCPLNAVGIEQARKIAPEVAKLKIEYIISSDLARTRQTAEVLNEKLHLDIEYDARIREKSAGDKTGYLNGTWPNQEDFLANPHKYNAETWEDVFNRVSAFLADLTARQIDNVLIVTHGGIVNMLKYCAKIKKWNPADTTRDWFHGVENCSLHFLETH